MLLLGISGLEMAQGGHQSVIFGWVGLPTPSKLDNRSCVINHGKNFLAEYWFETFLMFDYNSWTKHAWDTQFVPESALHNSFFRIRDIPSYRLHDLVMLN